MPTYIIPRNSNDEITIAVVQADFNYEDKSTNSFLDSLNNALHNWFTQTDDGKDAWEASVEDFNIGDLVQEDLKANTVLRQYLKDEGITNMDIETYSSESHVWSFDAVLGNMD